MDRQVNRIGLYTIRITTPPVWMAIWRNGRRSCTSRHRSRFIRGLRGSGRDGFAAPGARRRLRRLHPQPVHREAAEYLLQIRWATLEDHPEKFRANGLEEWRAIVSPYLVDVHVAHREDVAVSVAPPTRRRRLSRTWRPVPTVPAAFIMRYAKRTPIFFVNDDGLLRSVRRRLQTR